jgi:CRP-like cAMP-binding protein
MATLDSGPRSATVIAREPVTLFRFREARFTELLDEGSLAAYKLVLAMARMLSLRHRELTRQLSESPSHVRVYQISE